jgi:hypothetical protein
MYIYLLTNYVVLASGISQLQMLTTDDGISAVMTTIEKTTTGLNKRPLVRFSFSFHSFIYLLTVFLGTT